MLTPADVERRVLAMGELVSANEWVGAARFERVLWDEVLRAISEGSFLSEQLAQCAIKTCDYTFPRFAKRATTPGGSGWKSE